MQCSRSVTRPEILVRISAYLVRDMFSCLPVPHGYMAEIHACSNVISTYAGIVNILPISAILV